MRKSLIAVGAVFVPWLWLVAASALYCALAGKMALFRWPWMLWLSAAPYWHQNWFMTVCVLFSALVPTFVLGLIGFGFASRRREELARPALYGTTGWANDAEMKAGGIRIEKSPI